MESSQANEIYLDYFKLRGVDPETYKHYQLPKYLPKYLPENKNARVLDIGCGYGQFLSALKRLGYSDLNGIDVSKDAVNNCNKDGLNVILVTGIEAYKIKESEKYDFIVMSHVLEHLPKEEAISTAHYIKKSLLKEGGSFLLMVPNAQSYTGAYWMYEDFTHYTLYTAGSVIYVLGAAGFTDIKFVDRDGSESAGTWYGKFLRRTFTKIYDTKIKFWNKVLLSGFHPPSPRIYTFELKALAK